MKTTFAVLILSTSFANAQVNWVEATTNQVAARVVGTPYAITPRRLNLALQNNTNSITFQGSVTNNGTVWLSTNATPSEPKPNGSFATMTDGRFYLRTNSAWVLMTSGSGGGGTTAPQFVQTQDVTVTATEGSLLGAGVGSLTLAANTFSAGKTIHVEIWGTTADPFSAAPTRVYKLFLGGTAVYSGSIVAQANSTFVHYINVTCRSAGAMGSFISGGSLILNDGTTTAVISSGTVNTTGTLAIDVTTDPGDPDCSTVATQIIIKVE